MFSLRKLTWKCKLDILVRVLVKGDTVNIQLEFDGRIYRTEELEKISQCFHGHLRGIGI